MSEMERLQRRLIPVNIVVMALALIAFISIMFLPLLTVDMSKGADAIIEISTQGNSDSGDPSDPAWDEAMSEGMELTMDMLSHVKFSVGAMNFAAMAFAGDPMDSVVKFTADIMRNFTDAILKTSLQTVIANMGDIPEEVANIDMDAIYTKLEELESSGDLDKAIHEIAVQIVNEADVSAQDREECISQIESSFKNLYDETKSYAGSFTPEAIVCTIISEMNEQDSTGGSPVIKGRNYEELLTQLFAGSDASAQMTAMFKGVGLSMFISVVFPAIMWLILFLFALLHLFAKNKRFMMWYVKLWGFSPCMVYFVVPLVAKGIIAAIAGEIYASILAMLSSLTWICGVCYLLLWCVSIFWAFPIKKKIRAMKKNGYGEE